MVSKTYMPAESSGRRNGKAARPLIRREHGAAGEMGKMMAIDEYHRRDEGSDDEHVRIGRSPDRATATRSDDPLEVYPKLGEVVQEVIEHFRRAGGQPPAPQNRPMMEAG
jgi:hypothetical protein